MAKLKLTDGKHEAVVDKRDLKWLSAFPWAYYSRGGYAYRRVRLAPGNGPGCVRHEALHRVIAIKYQIIEDDPSQLIDHRNGDRLDCRIDNLRYATHSQNAANRAGQKRETTSKFKGVSWDKRRQMWRAYIRVAGQMHHLGYFNKQTSAAKAYNKRAAKEFGEFARLNDVPAS